MSSLKSHIGHKIKCVPSGTGTAIECYTCGYTILYSGAEDPQVKWHIAKTRPHDASGIEHPEEFLWESFGGIYYPV